MSYFDNRLKAPKINTLPGKVTDYSEVDILVQKGNVLHLLMLLLLFVYCIVFAIINYVLGHSTEVILTLVPLPFVILSYILYKKGYSVLSKFINLFQITTVVGMLSMVSTPVTGVLAFYIPVLLGTQLTFHGKERKYAHILTVYALIALVFFLTTDIKIGEQSILKLSNPQDIERLHTEWFFNFFGAALATTFEIIFILSVSNKIQQDLFDKSDLVNKKNLELNNALQKNIENSDLISRQLERIKISEQELLKANSELDKFVYSVSHDLRSPLLSIKGLLSLVVAKPELDSKVSEYITMAQKSVSRLDETIAEILEYSRNSRLNLNFESFDVREMVGQIFESHRFIVEEGFDFKMDISGDSNIHSDRARMHTLLRNLIGNAVKYRRPGEDNQYVQFSLNRIDGKIIMNVKDNGEGIPEYVKPKVFEMFYRGSTTGAGTGLGLYICKQIVEKLDGTIELESEEKKGASFTVTMPDVEITK
jgi:signal transduction histidine kinase